MRDHDQNPSDGLPSSAIEHLGSDRSTGSAENGATTGPPGGATTVATNGVDEPARRAATKLALQHPDRFEPPDGPGTPAPTTGVVNSRQTAPLRPRGRQRECAALDQLIISLWAGKSAALVIRGPDGSGKSTLVEYMADRAAGCVVLRADAIAAESDFEFAALHQLCSPVLGQKSALPATQQDALGHVFGITSGGSPSAVQIGTAVRGLLAAAAASQPVVCIVNDAQWLDSASAQALGFAARRLPNEPVAIILTTGHNTVDRRAGHHSADHLADHFAGVPELALGGLPEVDTRALLNDRLIGPVDKTVRDRLAAESHGNPRSVELAAHEAPEHLAGGYGLPHQPATGQPDSSNLRRLIQLPPSARRMLVLAAADPTGDAILLWGAARRLDLNPEDAQPAVAAGIIELDAPVRFCDPFVRSSVYRLASAQDRRAAHRALASATDPAVDPARRAWHSAHAASGLDDEAANDLERTAAEAGARGGLAATAVFLARAVELTTDPSTRARRALAAAAAKWHSGAASSARRLLALAQAGPLEDALAAEATVLHAQIASSIEAGADRAVLLVDAAESVRAAHPGLAVDAFVRALEASFVAGRLSNSSALETAIAVRSTELSPDLSPELSPSDLQTRASLVATAALLVSEGPAVGAPAIRRALPKDFDEVAPDVPTLRLVSRVAHATWDDRALGRTATRRVDTARDAGALGALPGALHAQAVVGLLTAGVDAARRPANEATTIADAIGAPDVPYGRLAIESWAGHLPNLQELISEVTPEAIAVGEGEWLTATEWAAAVLHNGAGRYADAVEPAERGSAHADELGYGLWSMAELVEASVRVGEPQRAAEAMERLVIYADAMSTDWVRGIAARCRALLSDGADAEHLYRLALERLERTSMRADVARAHLLYGEWLRREGRRSDARDHLVAAHDLLVDNGYEAFLERARRELAGIGTSPRRRSLLAIEALTRQEAQIARMARAGRMNSEIAGELFISTRTVEWHLRNVYMKLGIESRRDLDTVLPG